VELDCSSPCIPPIPNARQRPDRTRLSGRVFLSSRQQKLPLQGSFQIGFERISQIHREDGVTILLVEQRVAEALERSDHGYVLETGHIVLEGPYQTLLADDRVRRSYLGLTEA